MAVVWTLSIFAAQATASPPSQTYGAALVQFRAGKFGQSLATLEGALGPSPSDASAQLLMARCDYELGDYKVAVAHAQAAVQLDPGNAEYHLWLGRMMGREADQERSATLALKTRREFKKAVTLAPGNVQARRALLEYDLQAPWFLGGSKQKARGQAKAIAELDPAEGQLANARLAEAAGDYAREAGCYRQVLMEKTVRIGPYLEAADFFAAQDDASDLQRAVAAAAAVNAKDRRLAYYRGVADVLAGTELSAAQHDLNSYLEGTPLPRDFPSRADALNWLGKLYEKQGNRQQAMQEYQAALRVDPNHAETRQALSRLRSDP
jgi:tetratricopeptide (TPR) repeat protein